MECFSCAVGKRKCNLAEAAVVVERNTAVVEEISVYLSVHSAVVVDELYVLSQPAGVAEGALQYSHKLALLSAQLQRVGRINCREGFVSQLVFLSADIYHAAPEIHLVEEAAPVHTVFRMIFNELSFELELYDRDSLMHFCGERVFY